MTADGIYHLPFFEIENFLLSEELLQIMIETYSIGIGTGGLEENLAVLKILSLAS